ncbi:MAG: hypothetical protein AAGI30_09165 [Planctomycetota bacterium]
MKIASVAAIVALAGAAQAQVPAAGQQFSAFTFGEGTINLTSTLYASTVFPGSDDVGFSATPGGTDASDSFLTFGGQPPVGAGNGSRFGDPSDVSFAQFPTTNPGNASGFSSGNSELVLGPVAFLLTALPDAENELSELIASGRIVSSNNVFGFGEESLYLGQITQNGEDQTLDASGLTVTFADLVTAEDAGSLLVDLVDVGSSLDDGELVEGYQVIAITTNGTTGGFAPGPATVSQLYLVGFVPTPGAAGLIAVAGLAAARRRRG